jgi:phosphomethylpyrimidine synthase
MTQIELAKKGAISPEIMAVAKSEDLGTDFVQQGVAHGNIVIPANIRHRNLKPCGIGKGLRTKVNANIGTSADYGDMDTELNKLQIAVEYKADALMDLSTGGDILAIRRAIIKSCPLPLGTVPIYQAGIEAIEKAGAIVKMEVDDLFSAIEQQAEEGVDFMTIHCGVTLNVIDKLKKQRRHTDVVSRGGAFLIGWMLYNERENPLYEQFDRLLEIARKYDITLSLGDGMRPGSVADATDRPQIEELLVLGELVDYCWDAGVQVMIEGPGHLPLDQIVANVQLEKRVCKEAPFYVLGPLVTDIASGYDHIVGAIGGAIAAAAGADFLCYVTPSEHLALPDADAVKDGIIGSRIAAHAADIVKGIRGAADWDLAMSAARKRLDWKEQIDLSIDKNKAGNIHEHYPATGETCSMCGPYCAMALVDKYLGVSSVKC